MCFHNHFAKLISLFFVAMFMFVFISDYKTWMPRFKIPRIRKKKSELKIKQDVTNN